MKKPLILTISLAAAVAVVSVSIGGYRIYKNANTRVEVSPVSVISVPLWEDNSSYGVVTTDLTQDVFISESQVIQEVLVNEGDTVSIGTPLMTIDNTLAMLDLEMQALAIDNIDLQIQAANRDIHFLETATIGYNNPNNMEGAIGGDPGTINSEPDAISSDLYTTDDILEDGGMDVSMKADGYHLLSSPGTAQADPDAIVYRLDRQTTLFLKDDTQNIYTVKCVPETIITPDFLYRIKGLDTNTGRKIGEPLVVFLQIPSMGKRIYLDGYNFDIPEDFYEMSLEEFMYNYNTQISDITSDTENEVNPYDGISSEERDRQLTEKRNQLTTLNIDRKEAVLKYEKMRKEIASGTILSTVNGQIKSVGDPAAGADANTPFISVTSQDGFYLKGTVNELNREELFVGQHISVTNMETGMMAEAEITSISDYPVSDNASSYGTNPNTSNYPFTAFLSETSGFKNNQSVSINITSDENSTNSKLYIPKAYVREDGGEYYVFIADEKGRLKKQVIEAGATMYGYYQEVKSGLANEDLIAFPYGKNVKEGVKTEEVDSPYYY